MVAAAAASIAARQLNCSYLPTGSQGNIRIEPQWAREASYGTCHSRYTSQPLVIGSLNKTTENGISASSTFTARKVVDSSNEYSDYKAYTGCNYDQILARN